MPQKWPKVPDPKIKLRLALQFFLSFHELLGPLLDLQFKRFIEAAWYSLVRFSAVLATIFTFPDTDRQRSTLINGISPITKVIVLRENIFKTAIRPPLDQDHRR